MAGWDGRHIFSREAVDAIYRYSGGIPRVVNLLCEHALISGYATQQTIVKPETIIELAQEFDLEITGPAGRSVQPSARGTDSTEEMAVDAAVLMRRLRRSH